MLSIIFPFLTANESSKCSVRDIGLLIFLPVRPFSTTAEHTSIFSLPRETRQPKSRSQFSEHFNVRLLGTLRCIRFRALAHACVTKHFFVFDGCWVKGLRQSLRCPGECL
jgi:hypothetical protein